jgi:hypothetical protein
MGMMILQAWDGSWEDELHGSSLSEWELVFVGKSREFIFHTHCTRACCWLMMSGLIHRISIFELMLTANQWVCIWTFRTPLY